MALGETRPHRIEFANPALRQFRKLSRAVQERIVHRVDALATDPRPNGVEKLAGENDLYRIRIGTYRVIYQIRDDVLTVLIVKVGHRREVYRDG